MRHPKVLIADDDRSMRSALRARLSAWGYTPIEAADGLEVIGAATGQDLAAVILDQAMPRGDGMSVARLIRRECEVPIIFLSGWPANVFESVAEELPNIQVLNKPLDAAQLRETLREIIDKSAGRTPQIA